ncbi:hypothetical protein ACHAWT_010715 [Skeletonema menzelii]
MTTGRSSTGRSPAPPRGSSAAATAAGGGAAGSNRPRGGSFLSSASGGGRPSLDAMRGRLSYGTAAATTPSAAAAASARTHNDILSPESAASTATAGNSFLAAISPKNNTASQAAAATAMNTAVMAARGATVARGSAAAANTGDNIAADASVHNDDRNNSIGTDRTMTAPLSNYLIQIGQDNETIQLRSFVQSLLGMCLPATTTSSSSSSNHNYSMRMTTPDPTTAAFYAQALYAKTNGRRPDDAYLAARAMSLKGEGKRAIWILDKSGLIGFGVGSADHGDGGSNVNINIGNEEDGLDQSVQPQQQQQQQQPNNEAQYHSVHNVSNKDGIRNALLLRTEAALLAGQCLILAGEYERAIAVYEEAMRFPPPPPPVEWGVFGYGYRVITQENGKNTNNNRGNGAELQEEDELDSKLADEMYIRQWREQSLSHMALIDDGDDERLFRLADNIQSVQFSSLQLMMEGIHPMARLCAARGVAYDEISNSHRAIPFLRMALTIDARCIEALDYVVKQRLLDPEEERRWVASLSFGGNDIGGEEALGISWLRDAYLARLRGGLGVTTLPPTSSSSLGDGDHPSEFDASPVHHEGLPTPSHLSLGSPDFVSVTGRKPSIDHSFSQTVDEAFRSLAMKHHLGKSSDILSHAAIRAYGSHDLRSALAYCTAIDAYDPFCRTAGYVHVATLVGLGLKRRLFELAHRLVDADPKNSLAWFAVGSYYYLCRRYDLAQRHFSRSTRLDPSSAECWIGFGCSFAVCDESDQALASFRAAQNKYAGSHVPLLYMGMEYLRTNHLSLAGHFLTSAQKTDASDPLCCNELGVWSYRRGDMEDAAFWFLKALRLHVEAESSALTSTDEALGMEGYILLSSKGKRKQQVAQESFDPASPHVKRRSDSNVQPPSTVLCAVKTPSGRSISASIVGAGMDSTLADTECIERCNDKFWEPTIFNLGQSYRKMRCYSEAIVCFEKSVSLNPGSYSAYAAMGFAKHLSGDVDGAIDSYHEALSRKPEDPFSSEMLTRALSEAVTYPRSSVFAVIDDLDADPDIQTQRRGIGSSILEKLNKADKSYSVAEDVDMSLA